MNRIEAFLTRLVSSDVSTSLAGALPDRFNVAKAGPYPLARHAALPGSDVGGELLLELDGLDWGPVRVDAISSDLANAEVTITLAPARLTGNYALFGLEKPDVELDTGGWMEPLSAFRLAADPQQITPEQFDQLNQANAQRDHLSQTANGRLMLSNYDQYNDDYNQVFQTNATLRTTWTANGTTQAMMDHTSAALDNGDVINPPPSQQTFGAKGVGYNENALTQQLAVWAACYGAKLVPAANATSTFSSSVQSNTGNTAKAINPMTGDQIYGVVQTGTAPSNVNANGLTAEPHPTHLALARIVEDNHGEDDLTLLAGHGIDEDKIAMVRAVHAAALRVNEPERRVPVHQGEAQAETGPTTFRYRLTPQPDGAVTLRLVQSSLRLDDLDIDTEGWPSQAAGDSAAAAGFIRGILADRIASALTRTLRRLASTDA